MATKIEKPLTVIKVTLKGHGAQYYVSMRRKQTGTDFLYAVGDYYPDQHFKDMMFSVSTLFVQLDRYQIGISSKRTVRLPPWAAWQAVVKFKLYLMIDDHVYAYSSLTKHLHSPTGRHVKLQEKHLSLFGDEIPVIR